MWIALDIQYLLVWCWIVVADEAMLMVEIAITGVLEQAANFLFHWPAIEAHKIGDKKDENIEYFQSFHSNMAIIIK